MTHGQGLAGLQTLNSCKSQGKCRSCPGVRRPALGRRREAPGPWANRLCNTHSRLASLNPLVRYVHQHTCLPCRGLSLTPDSRSASDPIPSGWHRGALHLGRHLGVFQIAEEASVSMQGRSSYSAPPLMGNSDAHASAAINLPCLPGVSEAPPRPWRRLRPSTGDVCCGRGGVCAWIHHARPGAWAEGGKISTYMCVCMEAPWPQ